MMHYLLMDEHMKRTAVLTEVFRCLTLFNGDGVSHSMILAHVMGVLSVPEEEVGGYIYHAIFLLERSRPVETNTPFEVGAETRLKISSAMASWLLTGPATEPEDDGGDE